MKALAFHGIQSGADDLDLETMVDGFGKSPIVAAVSA